MGTPYHALDGDPRDAIERICRTGWQRDQPLAGMFFVSWDWHLKNPEHLRVLEPLMEVLHVIRMPLLMLLAGTSTAFALGKRSLGGFALDRIRRLLGPLVFGILVVVSPRLAPLLTGAYANLRIIKAMADAVLGRCPSGSTRSAAGWGRPAIPQS